jgi:hypothetical protein
MPRLTAIVSAMLLVLMLWTGTTVHAAERLDCIEVGAETTGHYDGDPDQTPASSDKGVAHHHTSCGGHQLAAPTDFSAAALAPVRRTNLFGDPAAGVPGREPENQLRPPIA